jgi:hypothetical protein
LVCHHTPQHWALPNTLTIPAAITAAEIAEAEAELQVLEQHAAEVPSYLDA